RKFEPQSISNKKIDDGQRNSFWSSKKKFERHNHISLGGQSRPKSDLTNKKDLGLFSVAGSRDCTKGATKEDVFARCATNRTGIREATALRYRADGVLELTTQDGLGLPNNTASSTRSQIATRPEGTLVH
ncbi:MAG: hypothetical protein AAF220_06860, partial [Pseudomonadota bacterium]